MLVLGHMEIAWRFLNPSLLLFDLVNVNITLLTDEL